ncbi:hypothetical protein OJF2_57240 [Aquisphaera giovannonii]|uniref:Uncharacterized protein n=1 Tax=Aquisphaera giovannonii TaxID=406548 RepID=A0A5B9W9M0_9BACT|nr:hypothetical protein [Aquisphaera giovannonii]QEH37137.1 hypothetical protein OJF2_57240 [Aquisphaera giovannonii]
MPETKLKFRCYKCQQLIGVAGRKSGTTVACPRCRAELLVPDPEARPAVEMSPSSQGATPSLLDQIAAAIPDDLASIRPEDIRAEGDFANFIVTREHDSPPRPFEYGTAEPDPPGPTESAAFPAIDTSGGRAAGGTRTEATRPAEGFGDVPVVIPTTFEEGPTSTLSAGDAVAPVAGIDFGPSSIRPESPPYPRAGEVVLQPATVLAWSLLVLMAVPMAFIAGLLLGHFVWR